MNILNEIKLPKSDKGKVNAVLLYFWYAETAKAQFKNGQIKKAEKWKLKVEMFSPYAVRGLVLFDKGFTIRTDITAFNPLKLHLLDSAVSDKQIKKIAHLAELAGLPGLHVINHFEKLEPLKESNFKKQT